MMRVLSVALSLLLSAGTASAERAWVLWSATAGPPSPDPYRAIVFFPRDAYDAHDQCEEARTRYEQLQEPNEQLRGAMKKELAGIYLCLPDTVDPRGPKGR
jgi:hypothetical protein